MPEAEDEFAALEMAENPVDESGSTEEEVVEEFTTESSFLDELSSFESFDTDEEVEETVFLDESGSAAEDEFATLEMAGAPVEEEVDESSFLDELSSFESFDMDEEVDETVFLDESTHDEEGGNFSSDDSGEELTELLLDVASSSEQEDSLQELGTEVESVSSEMGDVTFEEDLFAESEELDTTEIILEESAEVSELEDVEQKLNALDQISAESLDELQDLLGSVQGDELELEEKLLE